MIRNITGFLAQQRFLDTRKIYFKTIRHVTRRHSPKEESSSKAKMNQIFQFIEKNGQVITVFSVCIGGAYFFGSQHIYHTVELQRLKDSLIEKEKSATEKEMALEKLTTEKEKALEKVLYERSLVSTEKEMALEKLTTEKEKALEKVLFEKEKTQAAEKRELEARIRELETQIKVSQHSSS